MKREELKAIVEGISDEQLQKILDINSADVEKMKGKYDADLKKVRDDLSEARNTITTLEAAKGDSAALQAELDKYKTAEADRLKAEQEAADRAKLLERFNAAKGDKEFSSEYTQNGVLEAFSKALSDPANTGKGDAELFTALTKDKDGVFKSTHPPVNMGGFKPVDGVAPNTLRGALYERYDMKG